MGAVGRAARYAHAARGLGPNHGRVNNFSERHVGLPGSTLGPPGSTTGGGFVPGVSDNMGNTTNQTITYHAQQNMADWVKGDTGNEQITFSLAAPDSLRLHPDSRMHAYQMFSLSAWNHRMKHDPSWRKQWGAKRSAADVVRDWKYRGVQKTDQALHHANPRLSDENAFVVAGRVTLPNYWLASATRNQGCISEGQSMVLILKRHEYHADYATKSNAWLPGVTPTSSVARKGPERGSLKRKAPGDAAEPTAADPKDAARRVRARVAPSEEDATDAMDAMWRPDDLVAAAALPVPAHPSLDEWQVDPIWDNGGADEDGKEYYWQWHPWVSALRTVPDPALYINATGVGMHLQIGIMSHAMRGPSNFTADQVDKARRACHPLERNDAYFKPLHELDRIELHLRVAQVVAA